MNGLDLFSGIGGITHALAPWVKPVAYCENEPYAQAVLLSRMASGDLPIAPIWNDVRTLNVGVLDHQPIDIIYGGFPCQDISAAGKGAGLAGERSGLVFEVFRLIGEIRPSFVFLENVSNIRVKGAERVVKELAALGYDCRWDDLSAFDVGAPHRRNRWWLLAHAHGTGRLRPGSPQSKEWWRDFESLGGGKALPDASSANEGRIQSRRGRQSERAETPDFGINGQGQSLVDSDYPKQNTERSLPRGPDSDNFGDSWWAIEPGFCRVVNGLPFRLDRLRGLGNAVVPAQAREAFERLSGVK